MDPQSSREARLDRALLLRNSTLASCSHSITGSRLAFGDISSFATGRKVGHLFHMRENFVSFNAEFRPGRALRGEKKKRSGHRLVRGPSVRAAAAISGLETIESDHRVA